MSTKRCAHLDSCGDPGTLHWPFAPNFQKHTGIVSTSTLAAPRLPPSLVQHPNFLILFSFILATLLIQFITQTVYFDYSSFHRDKEIIILFTGCCGKILAALQAYFLDISTSTHPVNLLHCLDLAFRTALKAEIYKICGIQPETGILLGPRGGVKFHPVGIYRTEWFQPFKRRFEPSLDDVRRLCRSFCSRRCPTLYRKLIHYDILRTTVLGASSISLSLYWLFWPGCPKSSSVEPA